MDKNDVKEIKEMLYCVMKDVGEIKEDIRVLKEEMKEVKGDVSSINVLLENQVWSAISIVAEGHGDLSHKLSEAVRINNDKEIISVKVSKLESDVNMLKKAVFNIA